MTLSLAAFGLFVLSLAFWRWKPGGCVARWVHMALWMIFGAAALVGILFSLFTFFWPPAMPGALVWSSATVVVLFFVAAANPAPPFSHWLP
jgi:hypothetical protein